MTDGSTPLDPAVLLEHREFIRSVVKGLVLDEHELDDVVQEAWVKAQQSPPRRQGALMAWLATVSRNTALSLRRGEGRRKRREHAAARAESVAATADVVARLQRQRMVVDAVLSLDEPYRTTVLLRYYEDLPAAEIARLQGIPASTVKTRIEHALRLLRLRFDKEHGGDRRTWCLGLIPLALPAPTATGTGGGALALGVLAMKTKLAAAFVLCALLGTLLIVSFSGRNPSRDATRSNAQRGGAAGREEAALAGAEPVEKPDVLDRDPNRIQGPDLAIQGVVLLRGRGAVGADVAVVRSFPDEGGAPYGRALDLALRLRHPDPIRPIAQATTGPDGGFRLSMGRRSSFALEIRHPEAAVTRVLVRAPDAGDPSPIRILLEPGYTIRGRVVTEGGSPINEALVCAYRNTSRMPPAIQTAATDEGGTFAIGCMPEGSVSLQVFKDGYASRYASTQLPCETEILVSLSAGGCVEGRIADDRGSGLARATLSMTTIPGGGNVGEAVAETDETGRYRIEHIEPGVISRVIVDNDECGRLDSILGDIRLRPGYVRAGDTTRYDVLVESGSTVAGSVVMAEDGRPVAGARVTLLRLAESYRYLREAASTVTGPDGGFVFRRVRDGFYAIEALAPGAARLVQRNALGTEPATVDFRVETGIPVDVQRVLLSPTGRVVGRVVHAGPEDLSATIAELLVGGKSAWRADVDAAGAFEFPQAGATEEAQVRLYRPNAISDLFSVVPGRTAEVTIDLSRRIGFAGVVVGPGGEPISDATVIALPQFEARSLWSLSRARSVGSFNETRTDADGRFFVPASSAGQTVVSTPTDRGWFVAVIHPGYAPAAFDRQEIPTGPSPSDLRFTLQPGRDISGRVQTADGTPIPGATVYLFPVFRQDAPFRLGGETRSGSDGRFILRGLADGEYKLHAQAQFGRSEDLAVEGGARDVIVVVPRQQWIRGVVVREDGSPVAEADVKAVAAAHPEQTARTATTDASGVFQIRDLDDGEYAIEVSPTNRSGTGGWFEASRVEHVAAGTDDLVIRVSPGLVVSGVVIGPDGKPVASAGIMAVPRKKPGEKIEGPSRVIHPHVFTGPKGEFRLAGLSDQPLDLWVAARGHPFLSVPVQGGTEGLTIELPRGGVLAGTLLGPTSEPLGNRFVRVEATDEDAKKEMEERGLRGGWTWWLLARGLDPLSCTTDRSGRFRLDTLAPGEYRFDVREPGLVIDAMTVRTDDTRIVLRLYEPLSIRGRLLGPDGEPMKVQPTVPRKAGPDGTIVMTTSPIGVNAYRDGRFLASAEFGTGGTFVINGLPPGPVVVKAWAGGYPYKLIEVEIQAGTEGATLRFERAP